MRRWLPILLLAGVLAGCAALPPDRSVVEATPAPLSAFDVVSQEYHPQVLTWIDVLRHRASGECFVTVRSGGAITHAPRSVCNA